ncbi:class I SAM-dependent methyltransferase [Candidatus Thorarchaeota archaeon]|nr:MAG: class I SAM-dependent methyltransferase [Candidatus Thorarchaeota archaeon]
MAHVGIRDCLRINLLEYTRNAFNMLPPMENPSILDVGCGTGLVSIELARMSNGHVTAIDTDLPSLIILQRKIKELELPHRFLIKQVSMLDLHLLGESYDIIWAEGSIYAIGFERGIRDWKQLLRKNGFLVVHDDDTAIEAKLKAIKEYGYKVIGQIEVSHEEWEERYYKPLLKILATKKLNDSEVIKLRKELDTFKRIKMGSVFFVMQNKS